MKKDFLIESFYLIGTIFVLVATGDNMSVGTIYWTRLILLYLMAFYAVLNIVTFVLKRDKMHNAKEAFSKRKKYSQYFELIMGAVFVAAFGYNLFAK